MSSNIATNDDLASWKRSKSKPERLREAAQSGDLATVTILIREGVDVNDDDSYANTALHLAAASNQIDIMKELLLHHANVNAADKFKLTPLHIVTSKCNIEAIQLLLKYNVQVNAVTHYGVTPLMRLCTIPHSHSRIAIQMLLQHRAKVELYDTQHHYTALHYAVTANNLSAVVTLLQDGKANIDVVDGGADGNTPIMLAALQQSWTLVEELTALNADLTIKRKSDGCTVETLPLPSNNTQPSSVPSDGQATPPNLLRQNSFNSDRDWHARIKQAITKGQQIRAEREKQRLDALQRQEAAKLLQEQRRKGITGNGAAAAARLKPKSSSMALLLLSDEEIAELAKVEEEMKQEKENVATTTAVAS